VTQVLHEDLEISAGGCDFLCVAAEKLGVLDAELGQFFTLYEISRAP